MEYFFYSRPRPDAEALWDQLTEAHWSFMDRYADEMIARGPTLTPDRATATGSMHIVDLPDAEAARVFAFDEPNYLAGVYDEVLVHRWSNTLGRTMWEFTPSTANGRRFLIIGHGTPGMTESRNILRDEHHRLLVQRYRESLIACGPLLSDDGTEWVGTAMLAELPDRASAEAMLAHGPHPGAGLYERVEVHNWRFGGRPRNDSPQTHQ
jgi:uncharacterized protein YciI